MLPSKTNNTSPCTPVSSNCVIWQGPDIACIDLCNGDTVSDVVAKLATKLCEIIDASCACDPDLTGLDFKCLTAPTPEDLVTTLQLFVDEICDLKSAEGQVKISDLPLPECLYYRDSKESNQVTALPLTEWAVYIGNQLCSVISSLTTINQNFKNLSDRVATLEACVLPCTPNSEADFTVVSSCLFKGREVSISTLILAIEQELCKQITAVGSTTEINGAIAAQGVSSSGKRLSVMGTLGDIDGWIASPKNLAESNTNQWKLLNDLYTAVSDIQEALPKNCGAADFVFTYNTLDTSGNGVPDAINLNFQSTKIPEGFTDCNGSTTVTITDSDGTTVTSNINVSGLISSSSGVNINIEKLNRLSSLNLSIPFCVTDGNSQCADRQQVIIPLSAPCPSGVVVSAGASYIQVTFPNTLGNQVSYELTATSQSSGGILGTTTLNNPSASVDYTFTGATPGDTYDVQIVVISGGSRTTCPKQSATIPGVICNDVEITTPSTAVVESADVFLGLYDSGVTVNRYWYDAADGLIKEENVGATVPCDSPILSSPTMDYLGTPGDVAVTVSYGTEPSPVSAEISWSIDDITYNGLTSGADGLRTIATGQTNGSVYIKVQTTCTGPIQSVPSKLRYDFATGVWTTLQSPQECLESSLTNACPAGTEVARQYLECGSNTYTVFGGSAASYWFYVGKREVANIGTRYLYAGWDNTTNSVRSVVECCACPTFILSDKIQVLCGLNGDSVDVTLPYVLGAGEPSMSVITNPVLGTVTQGAIANQFTYTTVNPSRTADYADTFQVQLQPTVPGTGNCSLDTFTVQVQTINCDVKLEHTDQDIYVFVNTNGISSANGGLIKAGFSVLRGYWASEFGWSGTAYFIPTDSKRWLGYFKAIVDDGASWVQSADLAWQALEDLPTSWSGGVGVFKNAANVIIFSNDSSGDYHDSTLASGYGSGISAQPTASYKEDYDALIDMLDGTQTSLWAQGLGITQNQFPDGLSTTLYPLVVNGSGAADAANILQMISAYTAELIPPSKYGIKTAPDVTSYILQGVAASMPYAGATTPTNTITQLFNKTNFGTLAYLDQEDSADQYTQIKDGVGDFRIRLTRALKGCADAYPATTIPALSVYEVEDCSTSDVYYVSITDQSCGTIANGSVIKLNNPGATFSPGGGRADWTTLTNKCVTVLDNCSAVAVELATDLDSRYDVCGSCTP